MRRGGLAAFSSQQIAEVYAISTPTVGSVVGYPTHCETARREGPKPCACTVMEETETTPTVPIGTAGIPPAPMYASTCLQEYETKWPLRKHNTKRRQVKDSRYIDDTPRPLCLPIQEIYPKRLAVTEEATGALSTTLLGFALDLHTEELISRLYDKARHFGFALPKYSTR